MHGEAFHHNAAFYALFTWTVFGQILISFFSRALLHIVQYIPYLGRPAQGPARSSPQDKATRKAWMTNRSQHFVGCNVVFVVFGVSL